MFFFGLEYALMFALFVFLLDFIPAIWGLIALALPFLYSFTVFESSVTPFILLACLFIPQFISGNVIEPKVMWNRLNLSGFVILLALIFWSGMWGLVGAFLAVPLMATMNIVFARFETTKWISVLLSKDGEV
jgi:predicted PurR-regulated permease PerM